MEIVKFENMVSKLNNLMPWSVITSFMLISDLILGTNRNEKGLITYQTLHCHHVKVSISCI